MAYDLATVTNSGNQLLASVVSDRSSLVIDKIEVSGTQLASSTDLKSMTSISNVVQTLSANGYQKKDSAFIISTVLDNSSVTADYQAWVFGIWAHETGGGSPILMSVITSTSSPDTITKGSGTPVDYNYKFVTTFSNTSSLAIQMSSDTYATNDTVLHNSGNETATGTKTFQEIKVSNDKFPSLVQTDGQYITLDGGNSELIPANDSKVVHTTGDETVDGKKVFKVDPVDGAGNTYAKTVDVNQQLDKKVNVADMRKPASDVAGIEEVNAKQDKIGYTPADDSKVVHNTGNESINGIKIFTDGIGSISINSASASTLLPNNSLTDLANGNDSNYQYFITGIQPVDAPYSSILYGMIEIKQYSPNNKWIIFYDNVKKCIFYKNTTGGAWSSWATLSNDSTVAHLSGANNFDTTPTVNNNPLLLASSLPSDLARTGSNQEFTGKNTFDTAPIDKTTGNPYITKDGVPSDVVRTGQAQTFTAAQTFSIAPTIKDASTSKGDNQAATMADLKSVEESAWRVMPSSWITSTYSNGQIHNKFGLYKIDQSNKIISFIVGFSFTPSGDNTPIPTTIDFSSVIDKITSVSGSLNTFCNQGSVDSQADILRNSEAKVTSSPYTAGSYDDTGHVVTTGNTTFATLNYNSLLN